MQGMIRTIRWVRTVATGLAVAGLALAGTSAAANAASLRFGGASSQPAGHHAYCRSGGHHCGSQKDAGPVAMTDARWAAVRSVNAAVNRSIRPVSDKVATGQSDHWKVGGKVGDCEDYALAKRSKLMAAGFKPSQLSLAKAKLSSGEAHIVLVLRTTKGDYALDNLRNEVRLWNRTGYRFQKATSPSNASVWLSVGG